MRGPGDHYSARHAGLRDPRSTVRVRYPRWVSFQTVYDAATGSSHLDCAFLARRFDPATGDVEGESESLVVTSRRREDSDRGRMATRIGTQGRYTGLWRSAGPEPRLWACARRGWVGVVDLSAPADTTWERDRLTTRPSGLCGVDAGAHQGVYVWGSLGAEHTVHRYPIAGGEAAPLAHPDLRIAAMVGDAERLVAVGDGAASYGEGTWARLRVDTDSPLVAVALAEERVVACTDDGVFVAGTDALTEFGRLPSALPGDIRAIAWWHDALWIAAGRLGLWRMALDEGAPVCVRDDCDPRSLDARGDLLFATSTLIASTADGTRFEAAGKDFVLHARGDAALGAFTE